MWQNLTRKHQSSLFLGESVRPSPSSFSQASLYEWEEMVKLSVAGTNLHIPNKPMFPGFCIHWRQELGSLSSHRKGRVGLITHWKRRDRKKAYKTGRFYTHSIREWFSLGGKHFYTPEATGVTVSIQHKLTEAPVMIHVHFQKLEMYSIF